MAGSPGAGGGTTAENTGAPPTAKAAPSWQQIQSAPPPAAAATSATAAPGTPQAAPVAPVSPLDATYYSNLAALKYSLGGKLAGLQNTYNADQAGYTAGGNTLTTALPATLRNTRNTANSQGLLDSGIEAQRSGANEATYAQKMGALLAKWQSEQGTIGTDTQGDVGTYDADVNTQYQDALSRAEKSDLANSPTTPTPTVAQAAKAKTLGVKGTVANMYGPVTSLSRGAANSVGGTTRTAAGAAGRNASKGVKAAAIKKALE